MKASAYQILRLPEHGVSARNLPLLHMSLAALMTVKPLIGMLKAFEQPLWSKSLSSKIDPPIFLTDFD
jgi:hypothetical protein